MFRKPSMCLLVNGEDCHYSQRSALVKMFPEDSRKVIECCSVARDVVYLGSTEETIRQETKFLFEIQRTKPQASVAKPLNGCLSLCRNLWGSISSEHKKNPENTDLFSYLPGAQSMPKNYTIFNAVYPVLQEEMQKEFSATPADLPKAKVTDSVPLRDANGVSMNGASFEEGDYYCASCFTPLGNMYLQCMDCSTLYCERLTQKHFNLCHVCHSKNRGNKLSEEHKEICRHSTNTERCSECPSGGAPACSGHDCGGACLDHCKKNCHSHFEVRYRFFLPAAWKEFERSVQSLTGEVDMSLRDKSAFS